MRTKRVFLASFKSMDIIALAFMLMIKPPTYDKPSAYTNVRLSIEPLELKFNAHKTRFMS
jgi:hypothetical protein